jgi:cyclopropane fatty-acyl-phospholipid synthase-like methyltransferase
MSLGENKYYMNQSFEANYYLNEYQPGLGNYLKAGITLANRIKDGEQVLDIGCGNNEFKTVLNNVIGIDSFNTDADILVAFDDYVPEIIFDVVFCLGVFHFCSDEVMERRITKIKSCTKSGSRVYWRNHPVNTGDPAIDAWATADTDKFKQIYTTWLTDHNLSLDSTENKFDLYPWNFEKHYVLANKFGFKVTELCYDRCAFTNEIKIFAEWTKL